MRGITCGYWAWDWANSYEQVRQLDREQRLVHTAAPHGLYGFRKGQRCYFLNLLEELGQPGEWYLGRAAGVLYFWPPAEAAEPVEATLSLLDQPLLRLSNVAQVTFQGLILEATRGNGVRGATAPSKRCNELLGSCSCHSSSPYCRAAICRPRNVTNRQSVERWRARSSIRV